MRLRLLSQFLMLFNSGNDDVVFKHYFQDWNTFKENHLSGIYSFNASVGLTELTKEYVKLCRM